MSTFPFYKVISAFSLASQVNDWTGIINVRSCKWLFVCEWNLFQTKFRQQKGKAQTAETFFLAGRSMMWWAVSLTFVNVSSPSSAFTCLRSAKKCNWSPIRGWAISVIWCHDYGHAAYKRFSDLILYKSIWTSHQIKAPVCFALPFEGWTQFVCEQHRQWALYWVGWVRSCYRDWCRILWVAGETNPIGPYVNRKALLLIQVSLLSWSDMKSQY